MSDRFRKIFLLVLLIVIAVFTTTAQTLSEFSTDHTIYMKEVEKMLKNTKRDDCKEVAVKFSGVWIGGFFDMDQKDKIIEISNIMLKRKMRVYPYFFNFLELLRIYTKSEQPIETFDAWERSLEQVLLNSKKGNHKNFTEYVKFSNGLFTKNALYVSQAKTWSSTNFTYKLSYDKRPMMEISRFDLFAYTRGDTITIHNTKGTYYPLEKRWTGDRGTVYWDRAGLDSSDVYCTFGEYELDLSKSIYSVDSVTFYYKSMLKQSLTGLLTDKLVVGNQEESSSYPRFDSYEEKVQIDNIAHRVSYMGGFSSHGTKIIGTGTRENKAIMTFYRPNDSLALIARSKRFRIKKGIEVKSSDAEVVVYLGEDSIYHPGLALTFKIPTRTLQLLRGESGTAGTTFTDSYHRLEDDIETIVWELDSANMKLDIVTGKGKTAAVFESANYFEQNRLDKYQHIMDYNPISVIKKYSEDLGTNELYAEDLAKRMGPRYTIETIRRMLFLLVQEGFIYYDQDKELVTVRPKTYHYVFANAELIDYDIIKIKALTRKTTGNLNLHNYNLDLNGVKDVMLSDSQFVVIFPRGRRLTVKKNRDMAFSGKVFAGRMDFDGEGFSFSYENFELGLNKIDHFLVNIPGKELDRYAKPKLIPLKTALEDLKGSVTIDDPNNKAGLKDFPAYPIFESLELSYAFYDKKSILDGVYTRDKFYFELQPFIIDSLNTFKPSGLYFDGTMMSASIFEEFPEQLKIQADLSLGFQTTTDGAWPVYTGKGTFTDSMFLSNHGFRGKGEIAYLSSTQLSNDIIFYPDSLNSNTDTFHMVEATINGKEFPNCYNSNVYVHWKPYSDSMVIKMVDKPFGMYDNQSALVGNVVLTPRGLIGAGIMEFEGANLLISNEFKFKKHEFDADTAELKFKSHDKKGVAFLAPNVKAHINFNKRMGKFQSNLSELSIQFPYNQYKTSIDEFLWDMDEKTLDFRGDERSLFISTHPDQDSLKFNGDNAIYSLITNILDIKGVEYIRVADAKIIPDTGEVTINPGARMKTLENAKILVDTMEYYHAIYEATVDIYGKNAYQGSGTYDFINENGEREPINFHDINAFVDIDQILKTQGNGKIEANEDFRFNERIKYKGDVRLLADREFLRFDGFAKLDQFHSKVKTQWFSFSEVINPDSLFIRIEEPVNENKTPLYAGFMFAPLRQDIYTTLMDKKKLPTDKEIFTATGILVYEEESNNFLIGNPEKILDNALRGNYFKYNDETGDFYGEGIIDFTIKADLVDIKTAGNMRQNVDEGKYVLDIVLGIRFEFDKELLQMMGNIFQELTFDMPDVTYTKASFEPAISEFVDDDKKRQKMMEEYEKTGVFTKPSDLDYTFFFTDLEMMWDPQSASFVTTAPIGIGSIGDKAINKKILGFMEFGKKSSGDYFNIYMQAAAEEWYYFSYKNKIMSILTSNGEFTKILTSLDLDKRKSKGPDKQIFVYQKGGSKIQKNAFIQRMKSYQNK